MPVLRVGKRKKKGSSSKVEIEVTLVLDSGDSDVHT